MGIARFNGLSDKYVSERHHYASQTKLTAGQAAKIISKEINLKVSARDLVNKYVEIHGCEPEWHHSGHFKANGRSRMGRTFFFTDNEINELINHLSI